MVLSFSGCDVCRENPHSQNRHISLMRIGVSVPSDAFEVRKNRFSSPHPTGLLRKVQEPFRPFPASGAGISMSKSAVNGILSMRSIAASTDGDLCIPVRRRGPAALIDSENTSAQ